MVPREPTGRSRGGGSRRKVARLGHGERMAMLDILGVGVPKSL